MSIYIFTESFTLSRGIIYAVQEVPSLKPGYETVHQLREAFKERNFNDFKEELMSVQTRHLSDGFSYLRQQGYMFDTSIRDNILLGKDESDNFKEIIKQLDIDLTKSITDLSGGEKQKVAIARLLVNPNPIILLDESFSSIDIASSKMILGNLSKLENTTVIMITHRMQELEDIEYETIDILNSNK